MGWIAVLMIVATATAFAPQRTQADDAAPVAAAATASPDDFGSFAKDVNASYCNMEPGALSKRSEATKKYGEDVWRALPELGLDAFASDGAVAMPVHGRWLVGTDRGEWSSDLVFVGARGEHVRLLEKNIEDIHRIGDRLLAVSGQVDLAANEGMLYEVLRSSDGTWSARPWKKLPGPPAASWIAETGELVIEVMSGNRIVITPAGTASMALCWPK